MILEPHQERVVSEVADIDTRVRKLKAFLDSIEGRRIDYVERLLMCEQMQTMRALSTVLHKRIEYWRTKASAIEATAQRVRAEAERDAT
jgi:hypothetical protein